MLTLEMIQDAQAALRGIARRTPLEGAPKIEIGRASCRERV